MGIALHPPASTLQLICKSVLLTLLFVKVIVLFSALRFPELAFTSISLNLKYKVPDVKDILGALLPKPVPLFAVPLVPGSPLVETADFQLNITITRLLTIYTCSTTTIR